ELSAGQESEVVREHGRPLGGSRRDALDLALRVDAVDARVGHVGAIAGAVRPQREPVRPPRSAPDDLGLALEASAVDLALLAAAPDRAVLLEGEILDVVDQAEPDRLDIVGR